MKLSIAFLLPVNEIAGGLFIVYRQAKYLVDQGHHVTFVYEQYKPEMDGKYKIDERISIIKTIDKIPDSLKFDLAVATLWRTAFTVLKIKSEKYAYFVQSDERKFFDEEARPIDRAMRMAVQYTYNYFPGAIITEAKWIAALLKREFNREAFLAPNGVDLSQFNPDVAPLEDKPSKLRFLVEGPTNTSYKRIEYTHLCLSKFYKDIDIWHIANDGVIRPYWNASRYFSKVPYHDMAPIMRSCDLIIKLSTVEGFFGPPLEMMACGGTAITSNVTGHDELLINNVNGYVVPMDNYVETIAVIDSVISNGRVGLETVKSEAQRTALDFDWKKQHPKFEEAIKNSYHSDSTGNRQLLSVIGEMFLRDPIYFLKAHTE